MGRTSDAKRKTGQRFAHAQPMLAYLDSPLEPRELIKRTVNETLADNGLGLAAQLAYYIFLALFPALLFFIALASFLPAGDVVSRAVGSLQGIAPPDVLQIIRDQLEQLTSSPSGGILTFGFAAALWSSSAAMVAVIDALNRAYDVEEARAWWQQRVVAILLTVGVALFILVSFSLVIAGPELAEYLASQLGLGAEFEWAWKILQWPVVFALIVTGVGLIYYFAPDVDQDFIWITPGALLATVLWLLGSLAFRFYVVNFGAYNETYGAIGAVMVLMTWLYMTGLAIVIGAEMNAEIEHASPHGKEAGEKVPGERKTIGPRAARLFAQRRTAPGRREQPAAPDTPARPRDLPYSAGGVMQDQSIADVLKSTVQDTQALLSSEIALAKAELREEVRKVGTGATAMAAAAMSGLVALVFLLTALAWAVPPMLAWPAWSGFALVGLVVAMAAAGFAIAGRRILTRERHMPLTADTMKENLEWMRARTS